MVDLYVSNTWSGSGITKMDASLLFVLASVFHSLLCVSHPDVGRDTGRSDLKCAWCCLQVCGQGWVPFIPQKHCAKGNHVTDGHAETVYHLCVFMDCSCSFQPACADCAVATVGLRCTLAWMNTPPVQSVDYAYRCIDQQFVHLPANDLTAVNGISIIRLSLSNG